MADKRIYNEHGDFSQESRNSEARREACRLVRLAYTTLREAGYESRDSASVLSDEAFCVSVEDRGRRRRDRRGAPGQQVQGG